MEIHLELINLVRGHLLLDAVQVTVAEAVIVLVLVNVMVVVDVVLHVAEYV